jgi:hypothetical protein
MRNLRLREVGKQMPDEEVTAIGPTQVGPTEYVEDDEWTAWTIQVGLRLDRQDKKILIGIGLGAGGILLGAFSLKALAKLASGLAPVMQAIQAQQQGTVTSTSETGTTGSDPSVATSKGEPVHEESTMRGPSMSPMTHAVNEVIDETRTPPEGSVVGEAIVHGAPTDVELGEDGFVDPMVELLLHEERPGADATWVDPTEPGNA